MISLLHAFSLAVFNSVSTQLKRKKCKYEYKTQVDHANP